MISGQKKYKIYWSKHNPMFLIPNFNHITVNRGLKSNFFDQIQFICPEESMDFLVIFQVTKEEFDECTVRDPGNQEWLNCNRSGGKNDRLFSLRRMYGFMPGKEYFYISTATEDDWFATSKGACQRDNMKLAIKIWSSEEEVKDEQNKIASKRVHEDPSHQCQYQQNNNSRLISPSKSSLLMILYSLSVIFDQHRKTT